VRGGGSEVCGMERARFLKFLRVRSRFKTCGAGVDKKIQPAQDSNAHRLHIKGNQSRTLITGALRVEVVQSHRPGIYRTPRYPFHRLTSSRANEGEMAK